MDVAGPTPVWTSGVGVTQLRPARMLEQQKKMFIFVVDVVVVVVVFGGIGESRS